MGVAKNLSLEDLAEIMPDVAGSLQVRDSRESTNRVGLGRSRVAIIRFAMIFFFNYFVTFNDDTYIRWYLRIRYARKEQYLLFDLFKAFD